jgi:hypothetical protein
MNLSESLSNIWDNHVRTEFNQGMICSEKHLQALMFKWFGDKEEVFVEPKLGGENIRSLEGYKPDLLFTQGQEIVAVLELKYSPYYQAEPQNDLYRIQTFHKEIQDGSHKIYLKINPQNGDWNTQEYFTLSSDLLFVYGVIAKRGSKALDQSEFSQYSSKEFLHLKIEV